MLSSFWHHPRPFLLVILNQPLPDAKLMSRLWHLETCMGRVCADGGANRLPPDLVPDLICGDMDSVEENGKFPGVKRLRICSQDTTDFQKCLALEQYKDLEVLAIGALGGRLDQSMSSICTMHDEYVRNKRNVTLVSVDSVAVLCPANQTSRISLDPAIEGPSCGILPFGAPRAHVRSLGLRWELREDFELSFYRQLSTSNEVVGKQVEIETVSGDSVVFTASMKHGISK
ncbi:MAG: hypothetical protein SGCHY_004474 [Lobulomycetales sp.]